MFANVSVGTPKFSARTEGGVWMNQSVTKRVLNSLAAPSSKQMTNSPVRAEPLQRMRVAGREIPKVALFHVRDIGPAQWIENGHPAAAVGHERPLGRLVPMQFAYAPRRQSHVDAGGGV